jgi:hypothetical protein
MPAGVPVFHAISEFTPRVVLVAGTLLGFIDIIPKL